MEDACRFVSLIVVDDNPGFLKVFNRFLLRNDLIKEVRLATGGLQALSMIREFPPDVLIMDVDMPAPDGLQTLARVKEEFPRLKVWMMSVFDSADVQAVCLQAGADGFISKTDLEKNFIDQLINRVLASSL